MRAGPMRPMQMFNFVFVIELAKPTVCSDSRAEAMPYLPWLRLCHYGRADVADGND